MNRKLPREIALYLYNANCKVDLEDSISLTWTSLHASCPIIERVLFHNHTILIWVYIGATIVGGGVVG